MSQFAYLKLNQTESGLFTLSQDLLSAFLISFYVFYNCVTVSFDIFLMLIQLENRPN